LKHHSKSASVPGIAIRRRATAAFSSGTQFGTLGWGESSTHICTIEEE
jgi:hypothetical protein